MDSPPPLPTEEFNALMNGIYGTQLAGTYLGVFLYGFTCLQTYVETLQLAGLNHPNDIYYSIYYYLNPQYADSSGHSFQQLNCTLQIKNRSYLPSFTGVLSGPFHLRFRSLDPL
jgi:hypothetical protein